MMSHDPQCDLGDVVSILLSDGRLAFVRVYNYATIAILRLASTNSATH